jgi:hypothetical protein
MLAMGLNRHDRSHGRVAKPVAGIQAQRVHSHHQLAEPASLPLHLLARL